MALTQSLTVTHLPNGHIMAYGTMTFDSVYVTGGETMDVSSIFSGTPIVVVGGGDDGYVCRHNRGNAASGVLQLYFANGGAAAGAALIEATNATDASAVIVTVNIIGPAVQS